MEKGVMRAIVGVPWTKLGHKKGGHEEVHMHKGMKNLPLGVKEPRIMNTTQ